MNMYVHMLYINEMAIAMPMMAKALATAMTAHGL
jgi:hypothetical protein